MSSQSRGIGWVRQDFSQSAAGGSAPVATAWTPTITPSAGTVTLSGLPGTYGKSQLLGNLAYINATLNVTAVNSPNGGFFIRGLPIALNPATNDIVIPISIFMFGLNAAATGAPMGQVLRDTLGPIIQMQLYAGGTTTNYADRLQNGTWIRISGSWLISP